MEELGAPGAPLPSDKAKWVLADPETPPSGSGELVVFLLVLVLLSALVMAAYYYFRKLQSKDDTRGLQSATPFDDQDEVLLQKLREREYARGQDAEFYPRGSPQHGGSIDLLESHEEAADLNENEIDAFRAIAERHSDGL